MFGRFHSCLVYSIRICRFYRLIKRSHIHIPIFCPQCQSFQNDFFCGTVQIRAKMSWFFQMILLQSGQRFLGNFSGNTSVKCGCHRIDIHPRAYLIALLVLFRRSISFFYGNHPAGSVYLLLEGIFGSSQIHDLHPAAFQIADIVRGNISMIYP